MQAQTFTTRHLLTALVVIILWGMNFVVIKIGLKGVPPLLLGALRFSLVAFPAILVLPRPQIPLKLFVSYALTISLAQFAFLFSAMAAGMPAGLASLVLQSQAFFTLSLSVIIFKDKIHFSNLLGMLIAIAGLLILGTVSFQSSDKPVPLIAFGLILCAAFSWASGNIISKKIGPTKILPLVAWSALIPIIPFFLLSWAFEGADLMYYSLQHLSLASMLTILYLAMAATLIGYTLWGRLLASLPTHQVAPLTLLVPVIGLTSAWILLDEALSLIQITGAVIIMLGLLVNVFGAKLFTAR